GGAIVQLDDPRPPASCRWAGPGWERHVRTDLVRGVTAVNLAAADPDALAERWSAVLAQPVARTSATTREIRLDPGTLRCAPSDGASAPHIVGYEIAVTDRERVLERARARSLPVADGAV